MKKLFYLLLFLTFISSCIEKKQDNENNLLKSKQKEFPTIKHNNIGIILNNGLFIYDEYHNQIKKIGGLKGQIVKIEAISKDKFALENPDDSCNWHNFVKVKCNKFSGWVYGKFVFEISESPFTITNINFKIYPTKNFGIRNNLKRQDNNCEIGNQNPVIIYNHHFNKYEFVQIKGKKNIYVDEYFTLNRNNDWYDFIYDFGIKSKEKSIILRIQRNFNNDSTYIVLKINLKKDSTFGEVLSFSKKRI